MSPIIADAYQTMPDTAYIEYQAIARASQVANTVVAALSQSEQKTTMGGKASIQIMQPVTISRTEPILEMTSTIPKIFSYASAGVLVLLLFGALAYAIAPSALTGILVPLGFTLWAALAVILSRYNHSDKKDA